MKVQNHIAMAFALFTTSFASLMQGYRIASLLSAIISIVWVLLLLASRKEIEFSIASLVVCLPFIGCFSALLNMGYGASSHLAALLLLMVVFMFIVGSIVKSISHAARVSLYLMVGAYLIGIFCLGLLTMSFVSVDALQMVGNEMLQAKDVMSFYSMMFMIMCAPCALCMIVAGIETRKNMMDQDAKVLVVAHKM